MRIKLEEQERAALDLDAAAAVTKAEEAAREKTQQDRSANDVDDKAAQKAERDRRYANRKARQR